MVCSSSSAAAAFFFFIVMFIGWNREQSEKIFILARKELSKKKENEDEHINKIRFELYIKIELKRYYIINVCLGCFRTNKHTDTMKHYNWRFTVSEKDCFLAICSHFSLFPRNNKQTDTHTHKHIKHRKY